MKMISLGLALAVMLIDFTFIPGTINAQPPSLTTETFANLAQATAGAVVNISSEREIETGLGKSPYREFTEKFFEPIPETLKNHSLGSGFIVDPLGYVITNNHVVDKAENIKVILLDGREFKATIKGQDPETDLALIQIVNPTQSLHFLTLGDSDAIRVADWVLAVGNPFGLGHTVTQGIISAKGRVIGPGPYDKVLQTDALINPDNSGGPLLNLKGEVIGINTIIITKGQGIGFAIPSNIAKLVIPQLKQKGKVIRGMIGVVMEGVTPDLAKELGISETAGALVVQVNPGSPAQKAGIQPGDIITSFNGHSIKQIDELSRLVEETSPGTDVLVKVRRNGEEIEFLVEVAEMS